jgi:hypothetical protein
MVVLVAMVLTPHLPGILLKDASRRRQEVNFCFKRKDKGGETGSGHAKGYGADICPVAAMTNSKGAGEIPDKNPSPLRAIGEGFFTGRDTEGVILEGCLLWSTG